MWPVTEIHRMVATPTPLLVLPAPTIVVRNVNLRAVLPSDALHSLATQLTSHAGGAAGAYCAIALDSQSACASDGKLLHAGFLGKLCRICLFFRLGLKKPPATGQGRFLLRDILLAADRACHIAHLLGPHRLLQVA
jgi:hypothetical protein